MEQRLTLVTLGVADLARSRAFYAKLGWRESSASQESVAFFQLNGLALGLFGHKDLAEDAHMPNEAPPTFRGISLAWNGRSRAEVDAVYAEALACGARPVKAPKEVFWGGYSGYFADPDGHLWEVAHNPFFTLTEDGRIELPK